MRTRSLVRMLFALAPVFLALFFISSTTVRAKDDTSLPPPQDAVIPPAPDYSEAASWITTPDDPNRFAVDVIWVYPTVLYDDSAWLMDVSNADLVAGATLSVDTEAKVFSGQANVYAPLYRQMNLQGFNQPKPEEARLASYGESDIHRALIYYMEHFNKGRPFILAGHSQGSFVLKQLVRHNWGKTGIEDQLVAGYLIGWSITEDDVKQNPALQMCFTPLQTGCFVSYNSVAPGKQDKATPMIQPGAIVINPLTWTRNREQAPASLNLGSTFFDAPHMPCFNNTKVTSTTIAGFASARIKDFGLEVVAEDPKCLLNPFFPVGVYHGYDYSLFFENIRANVAQRIETFLLYH